MCIIIRRIFIGLGGNSHVGSENSIELMRHVVAAARLHGCKVDNVSPLYITEPMGGGRQAPFVNAVIQIRSAMPPSRLLSLAKMLERNAGRRRRARRNGPRPIDVDILDYGGKILGRALVPQRARLVLPHPEMHRRRFVLQPLFDIAPHWHHPVLDRSVRQLLEALPDRPGAVQRLVDSGWNSCDEGRLWSAVRNELPDRL